MKPRDPNTGRYVSINPKPVVKADIKPKVKIDPNRDRPRDDLGCYRSTYDRRGNRTTRVTARIVSTTIIDMKRRIHWRCRELGTTFYELCELKAYDTTKTYAALRHHEMTIAHFERLTVLLKMDDVDGWRRPFPDYPLRGERRKLADVTIKDARKALKKVGTDDDDEGRKEARKDPQGDPRGVQRASEC